MITFTVMLNTDICLSHLQGLTLYASWFWEKKKKKRINDWTVHISEATHIIRYYITLTITSMVLKVEAFVFIYLLSWFTKFDNKNHRDARAATFVS